MLPYLAIARTYYQMGEYYVAARNLEKALTLDPANPDIYGRLGLVYFHGKNYEGALEDLSCAVYGCTRDDPNADADLTPVPQITVSGQGLSASTLEYYFTLSSVMAALSTPQENHCPQARELMNQLQAFAPDDVVVMAIVDENRNICALVEQSK